MIKDIDDEKKTLLDSLKISKKEVLFCLSSFNEKVTNLQCKFEILDEISFSCYEEIISAKDDLDERLEALSRALMDQDDLVGHLAILSLGGEKAWHVIKRYLEKKGQ